MKDFLCLLFFLILISSTFHSVQATMNCHCFQDRTYNPDNKYSTDEYLLATTFNSFLSSNFNVPKRDIVMLKMKGGTGADDVIIALYVSSRTGKNLEDLTAKRKNEKTWQEILLQIVGKNTATDDPLLFAIQRGEQDGKVAAAITDHMLRTFFGQDQSTIDSLKRKNLSEKEITLFFSSPPALEPRLDSLLSSAGPTH